MAQEWTEGRLDELSGKVDKGFEKVDADICGLRLEMKAEFAAVRTEIKTEFAAVRAEMKTEFAAARTEMKETRSELTASLNSVQRTMVQMMVALTAAILAGFAGICTLIAATL